MDKEVFDVLLALASLPPASFASSETPISNVFLQRRTSVGTCTPRIPLVAWAIVTKQPLLPSSTSSVPQIESIDKDLRSVIKRMSYPFEPFRPRNTLERWFCVLQDIDSESPDKEWISLGKDFGNYESGMKLWKAIHESGLDSITSKALWIHYFFFFARTHGTISRKFPGICEPRLSTEKMVLQAMNDIENKPNWQEKIHDPTIVSKWRQECTEQGFITSMFDWMMGALRLKAKSKEEKTGIEMSPPPSVFHSDIIVDENLQTKLNEGFCKLKKIDERFYDWHPGSKEMVLDLVHPSMYCLATGRSHLVDISNRQIDPLALAKDFLSWYKGLQGDRTSTLFNQDTKTFRDHGSIAAQPAWISPQDKSFLNLPYISDEVVEHQYQWLPADMRIDSKRQAKFLSYVNSLKNSDLYSPLQELVSAFIPMFEIVLTFQEDECLEHHIHGPDYLEHFRPKDFENIAPEQYFDIKSVEEFREWKEKLLKEGKEIPPCPPSEYEDEEEDEDEIEERHWHSVRTFIPPEVSPFEAPDYDNVKWVKLHDKTIQIIFKLASVELTPEKPEYEGGVWHVEGTYSEEICATGIYYLDSDNITDPTLHFRQRIEENTLTEWNYEQNQFEHMNRLFGHVQNGDDSVQSMFVQLGHLSTPSKRAIVFPNTMQHKLSPFKLIDPSKPGHRRMIVMFLVNPHSRITSTAELVQQQCNERETAFAFGTTVDQLPNIKLGNLSFDVSDLIMREMLGKSKEAFERFKKIVQTRKEESKEKPNWQVLNERRERDDRIEDGEGTEEEIEQQRKERFREVVDFSAPMTYEEACWHRARLMQQRSQIMEDFMRDDEYGWNLCEH
ncbi:hypothetical protein L7F22_027275 [Adiantum nelumboides]|nr:hypothetical protein [Adiantum nelumboides]